MCKLVQLFVMNKYLYILLLFIGISFISCNPSFPDGKNFSITLNLDSTLASYNQKIYLHTITGNNEDFIDSVLTDGKGQNYIFYGKTPYQTKFTLMFEKEGPTNLELIVSPNDQLNVKFSAKDFKGLESFTVVDIPESNAQHEYYLYSLANDSLRKRRASFEKEICKTKINEKLKIQDSINVCSKQLQKLYQGLLLSDSPYLANFSIIFMKMDYGGIEPYKKYLLKKFPNYPPLKSSLGITQCTPETEHSKQIAKKRQGIFLNRFVNFPCPQTKSSDVGDSLKIVLHQNNGKAKYLSDYFGKYVLVDFWASWCGPCIASMPKLLDAQKKYGKDLEVCAVSLDKSNILWKKAIAKYHLSPLHHYMGIDGNGNVYKDVEDLGFSAIPQNYLLDRKGKIIGINLSGEELMAKLKEQCKY